MVDVVKTATNYDLWQAVFGEAITRTQFERMSLDHKIRLLRESQLAA